MKTVLLHGLGQTAHDWKEVQQLLSQEADCPNLFGNADCYPKILQTLEDLYGHSKEPLCLCGVSLGAMLALDYAIRHPEQIASLILVGVQYRVPTGLIDFQNILFRCMPQKAFAGAGIPREKMIALTRSMRTLDFTNQLDQLHCPVFIVCGQRDFANRKASQSLQKKLPHAKLYFVPRVGHEVNTQAPKVLAEIIKAQQNPEETYQ